MDSNSLMHSASPSQLIPQPEGRSRLDREGAVKDGSDPAFRSNFQFLQMRQLGMVKPNRGTLEQRQQYANIGPNETLYDLPCQFGMAKRFSPCGRYLLCFGKDMGSVMTYAVGYSSNGFKFEDFMTPLHETPIPCSRSERLCKDFCLFVDGPFKLAIVATSTTRRGYDGTRDERLVARARTRHSLPIISNLDDYSFWLVNYGTGKILDQLSFSYDNIMLSYHAGVSLCGEFFAVTSIQHQVVRIFRIGQDGKFSLENVIGPNYYKDDPAWPEEMLVGLKQRLVSFLYYRAFESENAQAAIEAFHASLHKLTSLAIWKAQFIDRDMLIVKLGPAEQLSGRIPEAPSQHCLAYCQISTGRILKFYYDSELADYYDEVRENSEALRFGGNHSSDEQAYLSSCGLNFTATSSNSRMERHLLERTVEIVASGKGSNTYLAKRRLASAIPYSSQVMPSPTSPFFDPDIFRFDDRIISAIDRVRSSGESIVKIFSRRTGQVVMKASSEPTPDLRFGSSGASRFKKYTSWIMHPHLPLAISTQQSMTGVTCNLHFYKHA